MRGHRLLLGALSLDLLAVLFGGVVALLPAFARDVLLCPTSKLEVLDLSDNLVESFQSVSKLATLPALRRVSFVMKDGKVYRYEPGAAKN